MAERPRQIFRVEASIRTLAQRFLYLGLVGAAFALMLLGKADVLLVERIRAHVTDAVAPILDFASRPVASAKEMINEVRAMAALKSENDRLLQERARLLQWQAVARKLEAENKALKTLLNFKSGGRHEFPFGTSYCRCRRRFCAFHHFKYRQTRRCRKWSSRCNR